jgi:hypothetical protein
MYEYILACKINQSKITFHLNSVRSNNREFLIYSWSAVSVSVCLQTNRTATWDTWIEELQRFGRNISRHRQRMRLTWFNITISTEVDMYGVAWSKWKKLRWYRKATSSIKRYRRTWRYNRRIRQTEPKKYISLSIIQLLPWRCSWEIHSKCRWTPQNWTPYRQAYSNTGEVFRVVFCNSSFIWSGYFRNTNSTRCHHTTLMCADRTPDVFH